MTATLAANVAASPSIRPKRRLRGAVRLAYWPCILGLVGLNAWWLWDARPMPSFSQVENWITVKNDPDWTKRAWWDVSHDNAGAQSVLRRALRQSPNDARARVLLGRSLGATGDYRGCAEQLSMVPVWSSLKPEALFGEGMSWLEMNRARDAERAFLAYVDIDPNRPWPRENLTTVENKLLDIYAVEDRWEEARALSWRAFKAAEGVPALRRRIVETLMRTRIERSHPLAALTMLTPIVAADPADWNARRALAMAANNRQDYELADRMLAICLAERPKDPLAWGDRLEMLEKREDFETLAEEEKRVPPEAETDGRIWMIRGRFYRHEKKHKEAVEALSRALTILPDDVASRYLYAQSLRMIGRDAEAAEETKRHGVLEATTKEIPAMINHYKDVTEVPSPKPDEVKDAMRNLSKACRVMGWIAESEAWAKVAEEY